MVLILLDRNLIAALLYLILPYLTLPSLSVQCCTKNQRVSEASAHLQSARIHHQPSEGTNAHDDGIREEAEGGEQLPSNSICLFILFPSSMRYYP
jgi:hypothetical protein